MHSSTYIFLVGGVHKIRIGVVKFMDCLMVHEVRFWFGYRFYFNLSTKICVHKEVQRLRGYLIKLKAKIETEFFKLKNCLINIEYYYVKGVELDWVKQKFTYKYSK